MDKLTIISGCLFLAADIFAIASIANPDWINTGESAENPGKPQIGHCGLDICRIRVQDLQELSLWALCDSVKQSMDETGHASHLGFPQSGSPHCFLSSWESFH
ncbi:modulator of smoothened protein isoform X2 [Bubalus bubalis]|uniref:modulator of smoothened protein isoform X2 n=1 Tax=Bubalus bubalis TaxID=89462 RepID=UPI000DBC5C68|nr:modulator of smoothened protein isoform X2 [Bubalus bubalis]